MRTIKEILIIVRDNLPEYMEKRGCWGMCSVSGEIRMNRIITLEEHRLFVKYINDHKPKRKYIDRFWWPVLITTPRINYLNKLISKL